MCCISQTTPRCAVIVSLSSDSHGMCFGLCSRLTRHLAPWEKLLPGQGKRRAVGNEKGRWEGKGASHVYSRVERCPGSMPSTVLHAAPERSQLWRLGVGVGSRLPGSFELLVSKRLFSGFMISALQTGWYHCHKGPRNTEFDGGTAWVVMLFVRLNTLCYKRGVVQSFNNNPKMQELLAALQNKDSSSQASSPCCTIIRRCNSLSRCRVR
jgi:hypothetical protein